MTDGKGVHVLKATDKLFHYYGCLNFAETLCAALIKTYYLVFGLVHAPPKVIIQILTLHELHHQINLAVRLDYIVELGNLRMVTHFFEDVDLA